MVFRRHPLGFYVLGIALLAATAWLPIACMLGQFGVGLVKEPAVLANVLLNSRQAVLLGRSVLIASLTTLVAVLLGVPVAIALSSRDLPLRRFFWFLTLVPVLIPSYVMAGAWLHMLSPNGWVNTGLKAMYGAGVTLKLQSLTGCVLCLGFSFFPIIALMVTTGLLQLDGGLQDTARLHTGRWGVFWHSTLPQIKHHLMASICLVMVFVLGQYSVPSLLGINTYPVEIFAQFSAFYDQTAAMATSLPLMFVVVVLIILQKRIMGSRAYLRVTASSDGPNAIRLGRCRAGAIMGLILLFAIGLLIPFASVFTQARGVKGIMSTLVNFYDWIGYTTVMAALAGIVATLISVFVSHLLVFRRGRLIGFLDIVCWFPIAIPGTVVGLGYLAITGWCPALQRFDSFGLVLLLAYVGMFSAFSIRVLTVSYRQVDPNVEEFAAMDCRHWFQRLWYVDARIHVPAMVVSFLLVFILAVGELNATVLLVPPGKTTLAVSLDNLLHYGASAEASTLCLIEAGVVLAVAGGGLGVAHLVRYIRRVSVMCK